MPNLSQEKLQQLAGELGIDLVAAIPAGQAPHYGAFDRWVSAGHGEGMEYLARRRAERQDVRLLMPAAQSIIMAGMVYKQDPAAVAAFHKQSGIKIAQYAWGKDYHSVFKAALSRLAERLMAQIGSFEYRVYVDTGPILERDYAALAGLGWIGKNTCLIHPKKGSYLFLGGILCSASLDACAVVPIADHCGRCRACLDACPTGALSAPYMLEPRKCIAYWTIEHRGDFPDDIAAQAASAWDGWVFGCDICQAVCPWNRKSPVSMQADFALSEFLESMTARSLATVLDGSAIPKSSALRRTGKKRLRRNLAAIGKGEN